MAGQISRACVVSFVSDVPRDVFQPRVTEHDVERLFRSVIGHAFDHEAHKAFPFSLKQLLPDGAEGGEGGGEGCFVERLLQGREFLLNCLDALLQCLDLRFHLADALGNGAGGF